MADHTTTRAPKEPKDRSSEDPGALGREGAGYGTARYGRWLRWTGFGLFGIPALTVVALLFAAYVFTPSAEEGYESPHLAQADSRYVETSTARYHYTVTGEGPPLLLVHGGGTWLYTYRALVDDLAADHTVHAVDLPGHGYTELLDPDFGYDLPSMTAAVGDFLDAVDIAEAPVVGHSWGGGWALRFAQENPDRVTGLALVAPSGIDYPDAMDWWLLGLPVVGDALSNVMGRGDVRNLLEKSVHDTTTVTDTVVDEYWAPGSNPAAREALVALQRNLDWTETEQDLATTGTPTLVLWGDQDAFAPHELHERFADEMPEASSVLLAGCGHSAHEECASEVLAELVPFLTRLPR